jgi:hypothetical protein
MLNSLILKVFANTRSFRLDSSHESWVPLFDIIDTVIIFVFFGTIPGENKMMLPPNCDGQAVGQTALPAAPLKPCKPFTENPPAPAMNAAVAVTLRGVLTDQSFCTHFKNFVVILFKTI